jgi:hypothetical protein
MACLPCSVICCGGLPCIGRAVRWCCGNGSEDKRPTHQMVVDAERSLEPQMVSMNTLAKPITATTALYSAETAASATTNAGPTLFGTAPPPKYRNHPPPQHRQANAATVDEDIVLPVPQASPTPRQSLKDFDPPPVRRTRSVTFSDVKPPPTPPTPPCRPVRGIRKPRSSYGLIPDDDLL